MDTLTNEQEIENFIDESLYSRQLYVLGHEAMNKMRNSNVLIIGMTGCGVEIAKNIILAGVKSVTIFDPQPCVLQDLGSQFFLNESDIGKRRDISSVNRLAELNEYVPVSVLDELLKFDCALDLSIISRFEVVTVVDQSFEYQTLANNLCRNVDARFISVNLHGLFGHVFCDFGTKFNVFDSTGEPPIMGMISSITQEENGLITCLEDHRHGLQDGDVVIFKNVSGMQELNDGKHHIVSVKGPFTFTIDEDTRSFGKFVPGNAIFEQVKLPKTVSMAPLIESLKSPEFVVSDFAKIDKSSTILLSFRAISIFQIQESRLPLSQSEEDAEKIISIIKNTLKISEFDEEIAKAISFQATGYIPPVAAFLGGTVAQEILKASSGKFYPIKQHLSFDAMECHDAIMSYYKAQGIEYDQVNFQYQESRYDAQIVVFGKQFHEKLQKTSGFLVGAGAIGCELLKLFALLGVATKGKLYVTDMDTIEKSNLNRQFLFRSWDVSKPKSTTAIAAARSINPHIDSHYCARLDRVGTETENVYNDKFFDSIEFVANALDNMEARKYMDRRCVFYQKPLLESGTLGTKGNTQVIIPHLTESYGSSQDPPEKTIPMCTLHNFPNIIDHTIQWAMDQFHGTFKNDPESVNLYLSNPNDFLLNLKQTGQCQKDRIKKVIECLISNRPLALEDCVKWARICFEEYFHDNIVQLLFNFPKDSLTSSGAPFWSGPKRAPNPIKFDSSVEEHMNFIVAAANLRAQNYGLRGCKDLSKIKNVLSNISIPMFVPKTGIKIQTDEKETAENSKDDDVNDLIHALPDTSSFVGYRMKPIEFEKDNDTNMHIDFVSAAANLRAINYQIPTANRHSIKQIAGKIIPAIATTTAVVSGLITLELIKVIADCQEVEKYKNAFVNLALPFFAFSEPIKAPKLKYNDVEWTLWDRFVITGNPTLHEFLEYFESKHSIIISMLSYGSTMLHGFTRNEEVKEKRLKMKLSDLVENITKVQIPLHINNLVLEILGENLQGEDIDVPYILIKFRE